MVIMFKYVRSDEKAAIMKICFSNQSLLYQSLECHSHSRGAHAYWEGALRRPFKKWHSRGSTN